MEVLWLEKVLHTFVWCSLSTEHTLKDFWWNPKWFFYLIQLRHLVQVVKAWSSSSMWGSWVMGGTTSFIWRSWSLCRSTTLESSVPHTAHCLVQYVRLGLGFKLCRIFRIMTVSYLLQYVEIKKIKGSLKNPMWFLHGNAPKTKNWWRVN